MEGSWGRDIGVVTLRSLESRKASVKEENFKGNWLKATCNLGDKLK